MLLDPQLRSNVFIDAIAGLLPCGEMRQQKELDLAYWRQQFQNGLYIAGKNNSSLNGSSHNTSRETEPLRVTYGVWSLLRAGHMFGFW